MIRSSRLHPLALALLAPLVACAAGGAVQDSDVPGEKGFVLDLEELRAERDERFDALDADGDGMITAAEFGEGGFPGHAIAGFRREGADEEMIARHRVLDTRDREFRHLIELEVERAREEVELARSEAERARREIEHAHDEARAMAFRLELGDAAEQFEALDADGDGLLSPEEYESGRLPHPPGHVAIELADPVAGAFDAFDENEDGVITRGEWPSPLAALEALDADGDGRLTASELGVRVDLPLQRRIVIRKHRRTE